MSAHGDARVRAENCAGTVRRAARARLLRVAALSGAMALSSVGSSGAMEGPESAPAKAPGGAVDAGPTISRSQVEAALPKLEAYARDLLAKTGVPGLAIAVVKDDRAIYAKGFGVREVDKPESVDADTVFQLASVSKPVGATVIAGLVGQGKVAWNDPIALYTPKVGLSDPWVSAHVSIADLYAHRSGLPEHAGDELEDLGSDRDQVLERLRYQPLKPLRITYAYGNFDLTAGANAAAAAAGGTWEDLSRTVLYEPAGMTSTSSRFADYAAATDRAVGHVRQDGRWVARYVRQPDAQSPAGGVISTANDMARWMRLQLAAGRLDGQIIIAAEPLAETHRPQVLRKVPADAADAPGWYGLGWNVNYDERGRLRLNHSGGFALGVATVVTLLPTQGLGIVVLTNGEPIGVPEAIAATFFDLAERGEPSRDWYALIHPAMLAQAAEDRSKTDFAKPPADPKPPIAASAIVGTYANAYYGPAHIAADGGAVGLILGPQGERFAMRPYDGNVWSYETRGENASGLHAATFVPGADGRAMSVRLESYDKSGLGTFSR